MEHRAPYAFGRPELVRVEALRTELAQGIALASKHAGRTSQASVFAPFLPSGLAVSAGDAELVDGRAVRHELANLPIDSFRWQTQVDRRLAEELLIETVAVVADGRAPLAIVGIGLAQHLAVFEGGHVITSGCSLNFGSAPRSGVAAIVGNSVVFEALTVMLSQASPKYLFLFVRG